MASQRDSINRAAKALCALVFEGGTITTAHMNAANRLIALAEAGGRYEKKYESQEERVLNRHLSLYKNKLAGARTDAERSRWTAKVIEQEKKIRRFKQVLDLDGL